MSKNYNRPQGTWEKKGGKDEPKVLVSFENMDITQGQTLRQWNESSRDLLLKLIEINSTLNKLTYSQAITEGIIVEYDVEDRKKFNVNNMPVSSSWHYPRNLKNKDVNWCKIRLGSTRRVIGFMIVNVFNVVFLDENHEFYPSEPNNT